jgi:CHASE2 domain-containing sensor protein
MILMKIVPAIPGHFSAYEWLALGVWSLLGLALGWRERKVMAATTLN